MTLAQPPFRSASTASAVNTRSLTLPMPADVLVGDLLVMAFAYESPVANGPGDNWFQGSVAAFMAWLASIGWHSGGSFAGSGGDALMKFWKLAGASEPSVVFELGATQLRGVMLGAVGCWKGNQFAVPWAVGDVVQKSTLTAAGTMTSQANTSADTLVVGMGVWTADNDATERAFSSSPVLTEVALVRAAYGATNMALWMGERYDSDATGTQTLTMSGGTYSNVVKGLFVDPTTGCLEPPPQVTGENIKLVAPRVAVRALPYDLRNIRL